MMFGVLASCWSGGQVQVLYLGSAICVIGRVLHNKIKYKKCVNVFV